MESLVKSPQWLPTQSNREYNKAFSVLKEIIMGIIQERRSMNDRPNDLLTTMIEMTDEDSNEGMNDQQFFDEILTLFMAGHETTAHTLVWTWYLLSKNPQVRNKLNNEVDSILQNSDVSFAPVPQLTYTEMVLQ